MILIIVQRLHQIGVILLGVWFLKENIEEISKNQCLSDIIYLKELVTNKVLGQPSSIKLTNSYEEFSNINQILIDDDENIYYSLGNLIVCPEKLNNKMKNKSYMDKRTFLISSKISHLKFFAEYEFTTETIKLRTAEVNKLLVEMYLLPYESMILEYKNLINQEHLDKNVYSEKLSEVRFTKLIQYLYRNGSIPKEEVEIIQSIIDKMIS